MRVRWSFGIVSGVGTFLAVLGCADTAAAASITILQPSACADSDELLHGIERGVGYPLGDAAPLHLALSIAREGPRLVARLVTVSQPAERRVRRLEALDCTTLADTVAVAVALALGEAEDATVERTPTNPVSSTNGAELRPSAARPPEGEPDPGRPLASAPESSRALEPALSLWLLGDVGSLPVPSLGASLTAELGWAWLDVVALGTVLFDRDVDLGNPNAPRAGAQLGLVSGGLLACSRSQHARAGLDARACIGAEVGRLGGVGTGISDPKPGSSFWVAPRVDATGFLAIAATPLRLGVWLTAAAPLSRDELVIEAVGRAHRASAVVARAAIGAELRFE